MNPPVPPGYDNCIAFFKLNDNAANSIVINEMGINGVLYNDQNNYTSEQHATGKISGGFYLGGVVSDYITKSPSPINGTGSFSLSVWVKTTDCGVLLQQRDGGAVGQYELVILPDGTIYYFDWNTPPPAYCLQFTTTRTVNDGVWHHIVFVRNGSNGYIYVDNHLEATDFHAPCDINGQLVFCIGKDFRNNGSPFKGTLDNISIFNKALSEDEIAFLWNNGNGTENLLERICTMGDTLYKVDEAIKVVYQAPNAESGLNNIKMGIYDELSSESSDYPDVILTEIGSSGRYEGSFTPDVKGDWTAVIEKADGSGKVVKHYSVGAYNVNTLGENIDGVSTDVGAVDAAVVTLDGNVATLDTKVDVNAGITDANVTAKADATDANVDAKAVLFRIKLMGLMILLLVMWKQRMIRYEEQTMIR